MSDISNVSPDVALLYKSILFRDPDEGGAAYWGSDLQRRNFSEVAWDVIESEETQDAGYAVISAYEITFGRVPDEGGFHYWRQQVDDRNDVDFLLQHLVESEEFQQKFGTNREAVIHSLYDNALGRAPDPEGLSYWMESGHTFAELVRTFMTSKEWLERAHTKIAEFYADIESGEQDFAGSLFDVQQPTINQVGRSDESDGIVNDQTPQISGTAHPGYVVILLVDGQEAGRTVADESGVWAFTLENEVEVGTREFTAVAQDLAGGTSEPTEPVIVEIREGDSSSNPDPDPEPDPDPNAPVQANDDVATAAIVLAPVVAESTGPVYTNSYLVNIGGWTETYGFSVPEDATRDASFLVTAQSLVSVLDGVSATLEMRNAENEWVEIGDSSSGGLLDLLGLSGESLQIDVSDLASGEYRLQVDGPVVAVGTQITITSSYADSSLTEFAAEGAPISGNILTDDDLGPDDSAVLRIETEDGFVDANGTQVVGDHGTLVVNADGSYTYTPNDDEESIGAKDVFTYQLVHGNGSTDTATLTVNVEQGSAESAGAPSSSDVSALLAALDGADLAFLTQGDAAPDDEASEADAGAGDLVELVGVGSATDVDATVVA